MASNILSNILDAISPTPSFKPGDRLPSVVDIMVPLLGLKGTKGFIVKAPRRSGKTTLAWKVLQEAKDAKLHPILIVPGKSGDDKIIEVLTELAEHVDGKPVMIVIDELELLALDLIKKIKTIAQRGDNLVVAFSTPLGEPTNEQKEAFSTFGVGLYAMTYERDLDETDTSIKLKSFTKN